MTVIIEYATISPIVLENIITTAVPNALVIFSDIDEDYYEVSVSGWLSFTSEDLAKVEEVIARYV